MSATTTRPIDEQNIFGPLVSRGDLVRAIIDTLSSDTTGLLFWIAERERRRGLPPRFLPVPGFGCIRGGLDFETYTSDLFPLIIVCAQREGEPERHADYGYEQGFVVQLGALVKAESEEEAIDLADEYGIALAACYGSNQGVGGWTISNRLMSYPVTEWTNPERRVLVRSVVTYVTRVQPVFAERYGPWPAWPAGHPPDPYAIPGKYPQVTEVDVTLIAEPLDGTPSGPDDTTTTIID